MRQERKVVTVLFCDLVGFTAQAEEMDPEDVASLLGPYQARLKEELERYGGTVEKFIGDAVMALFGAPVAHEDDPERAVRAALAIRDFAQEQSIELRIGVTTGEALVNVDARPDLGETMATGDVVNTAARLQAAAPANGILVSERTHEATKDAIEYGQAQSVEAKGKTNPVPVWEAVEAPPLQERAHTTPLVGRESELETLRATLARVRGEREPGFVTILGPPGIGKSRLVKEFAGGDRSFVWRRGRCLPYSEGVTFWALAEIVKTHAGILESDSQEQTEAKLLAAVDDPWVSGHLRPLVGLGEPPEGVGDRRAETFAAWRRFLTALADNRPLGLVLEDLHWADEALLDFATSIVEWTQETPLLLLCTARPELLERRPGWGANDPRAVTIVLPPLSSEETSRLVSALVDRAPEELVARAAGNPLYAEQYARLLAEHGSLEDVPATIQGIIAARLDGLPSEEKALLQDAAVIGRVFWSGALAALAGIDRWSVEERLLGLERRELVLRERQSSVEGDTEYAFTHVLLRDVANAEIPRGERADKHRLAAEWIESLGRAEDHSEMLAHHYLQALEYTRAAGREPGALYEKARAALRDAGDRALSLGAFDAAARFYAPALELCPHDDPGRGQLLFGQGKALALGRGTGEEILAAARDAFVAAGEAETAAEAELLLADVWRLRAEGDRSRAHLEAAVELVRERSVSPSKARVLAELSRFRMLERELDEAIRIGREALAIADALGLEELRAKALDLIGTSRMVGGDMEGREDLERSIVIATEVNSVESVRAFNNLGAGLIALGDLRAAAAAWDRGREVGRRFGETTVRYLELNVINQSYWSGSWSDALQRSEDLIAESEAGSPHVIVVWAYDVRGRVRLAEGDLDGALADARKGLEVARRAKEPQLVIPMLAFGAFAGVAASRDDEAAVLADELLSLGPARGPETRFTILFDLSVALCDMGRADALLAETARAEVWTPWVDAADAYARGDFVRAAEIYAQTGALPFEAFTRVRAAEQLIAEGRSEGIGEQLEKALAFWRSVGATRYIREAEALLGASA